jgi:hypothetical protein
VATRIKTSLAKLAISIPAGLVLSGTIQWSSSSGTVAVTPTADKRSALLSSASAAGADITYGNGITSVTLTITLRSN